MSAALPAAFWARFEAYFKKVCAVTCRIALAGTPHPRPEHGGINVPNDKACA